MEQKIEYARNKRYFEGSDTLYFVGFPIMVAGLVLSVGKLIGWRFFPYQMPIGTVLAAVGACLAYLPSIRQTNEKELDALTAHLSCQYREEMETKLRLGKELLRGMPPTVFAAYICDEEEVSIRRGRADRKCRTSLFSMATVFCVSSGLVIPQRVVSLVDDKISETMHTIRFAEIDRVFLSDEEQIFSDGTRTKLYFLCAEKDGRIVLSLPTEYSVTLDRFCQSISSHIE